MKIIIFLLLLLIIFSAGIGRVEATQTEVQRAASRIQIEANYLSSHYPSVPIGYFLAVSALGYVHTNVNAYVYDYYRSIGDAIDSPDEALEKRAGLCGLQSWTYLTILKELGQQSRIVQIYSINGCNTATHVLVETWFNNKWNLVDITGCSFFRDPSLNQWELLSLSEICSKPNYQDYIVGNPSSLVYIYYAPNGFNYIPSQTKDITISGTGTINLYPAGDDYSLLNLPNYVGRNWFSWENCYRNITYKINNAAGAASIRLVVSAFRGVGNLRITDGSQTIQVPSFEGEKVVSLSGLNLSQGLTMTAVPSSGETCYFVFSGINKIN